MLVVLVGFLWVSWSYYEGYFYNEDNETLTLTSRTILWVKSWDMIQERPFLGYGVLSFRDYGPQIAEFRLVHAHNEWVMIWFQTGLIGITLAVAIYAAFFIRMRRLVKDHPSWWPGRLGRALLVYMLIRGMTDASLADLVFPLALLLTLIPWTSRSVEYDKSHSMSNVRYIKPDVPRGLSGARG
jgi:O-antigen ligase